MPLSGEAIRLMNYIDDVAVTLRRVLATIPTLTAEERARVAEHLLNAKPNAEDVARGPDRPGKPALAVTVAIIGAGPLGRWLALSAARAGFRVLLEDVMPANLHHAVRESGYRLRARRAGIEARNSVAAGPHGPTAHRSSHAHYAPLHRRLGQLYLPPREVRRIAQEASSLAAYSGGDILLRTTSRTSPETVALVQNFWKMLDLRRDSSPTPPKSTIPHQEHDGFVVEAVLGALESSHVGKDGVGDLQRGLVAVAAKQAG
jgi:hypothetical protein